MIMFMTHSYIFFHDFAMTQQHRTFKNIGMKCTFLLIIEKSKASLLKYDPTDHTRLFSIYFLNEEKKQHCCNIKSIKNFAERNR